MSASNAISNSKAPPGGRSGKPDSSSSPAERFTLGGPSLTLDPRIHAYRSDIADIALAGQLFAPHYARPITRICGTRPTAVRAAPSTEAEPLSRLQPGDEFAVLDIAGEWAWGYRRADHHVGYVATDALSS